MSVTVSTCVPFVTARTSPLRVARYRLRDPSFSALKYTPLPSVAQVSPEGDRSSVPEITCELLPSAFMTYSFESTHVSLVES